MAGVNTVRKTMHSVPSEGRSRMDEVKCSEAADGRGFVAIWLPRTFRGRFRGFRLFRQITVQKSPKLANFVSSRAAFQRVGVGECSGATRYY